MKIKILNILLVLLFLFSCKTFTEEGRSLSQAKRAGKNQNYPQAVEYAIQAIQLDPEYYDAMRYLSGIFNEGTLYYLEIIDRYKGDPLSISEISGDVYLPADEVYQSYYKLDIMHSAVDSAGFNSMYDADEDLTYLCEVDYYDIELQQWWNRAMEAHYKGIENFMKSGHPMDAKKAHKHAVYIIEHYDEDYLDITEKEKEALEAAQIQVAVAIRRNSHSKVDFDFRQIQASIEEELQENDAVRTYATLVHSPDIIDLAWNPGAMDSKEYAAFAQNAGIDYVLLLDMDIQNSRYDSNKEMDQDTWEDTFSVLDSGGISQSITSTTRISHIRLNRNARVFGYARLLETASGDYYFESSRQEKRDQESFNYTMVETDTVNALIAQRDENNYSLMENIQNSFSQYKSNNFTYFELSGTIPLYEDDGETGWIIEMNKSDILQKYLQTGYKEYESYIQDSKNEISFQLDNAQIMPSLWKELSMEQWKALESILD